MRERGRLWVAFGIGVLAASLFWPSTASPKSTSRASAYLVVLHNGLNSSANVRQFQQWWPAISRLSLEGVLRSRAGIALYRIQGSRLVRLRPPQ